MYWMHRGCPLEQQAEGTGEELGRRTEGRRLTSAGGSNDPPPQPFGDEHDMGQLVLHEMQTRVCTRAISNELDMIWAG